MIKYFFESLVVGNVVGVVFGVVYIYSMERNFKYFGYRRRRKCSGRVKGIGRSKRENIGLVFL